MLDLSYNNYFTTKNHGLEWKVNLLPCSRTDIDSYQKESILAAQFIYEQSNVPITLLFSGGIDGEFMIRIFKDAKIPFKVAIINYNDFNSHDTMYAYDFCEQFNINPIIVDIDIKKFITSGKIYDIAKNAKCCAYQMPSVMYGITKLDGIILMANGEPYIKKYNSEWRWQETERVNSYMNWYKQQQINGTPDFLRYTPEMTVGFLQNSNIKKIVNNEHLNKSSSRTTKFNIYSEYYRFTPRKKYTGWELIEKTSLMNNEVFLEIEKLKKFYNGSYEVEYNNLIKSLQAIR